MLTPSRRQSASSSRGVDLDAGLADLLGQLGPDAVHRGELGPRGRQRSPRRAEPLQQHAPGLRADPRHRRQLDQVEQPFVGV